ncbi:hypothetical protein LPW26_05835 [Rhodopseudomonas sp. HC1]|uniref:hypothetical protein n=1 Tax=Rhodopseudomonas infernalis TaxID=2897386 RepID=UPI001EE7ED2F|nr:hypothetical protein [Rhodopseudomonas infernalis]MCG6204147.1 hypothetical protein [Rhodopseudomonas infernalis]
MLLYGLLAGLTVLVLFVRRPDQFLAPYIWVEDGAKLLPDFLTYGWSSFFMPVQGYLILATKLLTLSSFSISFLHFATVSLAITVISTAAVVVFIAAAPTDLKLKPLCAAVVLLIPTDPEVFAVGEYIFWWAGLLILLALVWTPGGGANWARWFAIGFGGLSSPIILPLSVLFVLRAWRLRGRREELVTLAVVLAVVAIQASVMLSTTDRVASLNVVSWQELRAVIERFFGSFICGSCEMSGRTRVVMGAVVLTLIVGASIRMPLTYKLLLLSLLLIVATTIQRNPASILNPYSAGPRYFFYPYVLLSWLLISVAASSTWISLRIGAAAIVGCAIAVGLTHLSRYHTHINWEQQVRSCAASKIYGLPVHFDGTSAPWVLQLKGDDCSKMVERSLFGSL